VRQTPRREGRARGQAGGFQGVLSLLLFFTLLQHVSAQPEKQVVDGVTYHVLRAAPDAVRIVWKDEKGRQLRTFREAAAFLKGQGLEVIALMNGGIFEPQGVPSGLLVQKGRELRPINRAEGKGNFYLQPNGIFLIGSDGAAVVRTDEYPSPRIAVREAVQSGPLLLREGKRHPAFSKTSDSRLHRNGVGITRDGEVVFVMTDFDSPKFPNLYEFAELFRSLGCEDALFLDGDLSQMHAGTDIGKPSNHFGSIIAVVHSQGN